MWYALENTKYFRNVDAIKVRMFIELIFKKTKKAKQIYIGLHDKEKI